MSSIDKDTISKIREAAEANLEFFIRLVHPNRMLGHVHQECISWWCREGAKSHQLVLLPRDHQKSALVAYRVAWEITKNPAIRILYISSTSNLATKQLKFIKDILTCDAYRFYWPEMVNLEETKREKWTEGEISVDHPLRKLEAVRDPTVFTAGLNTTITGLHCDIAVVDDVVVDENAKTSEGRQKVRDQVSYLASIGGTDSRLWAVGTRYHPSDLYNDMLSMTYERYDEKGSPIETVHLYEVFERQVESNGEFVWPRQQRSDGRWFGFNEEILSKKKAQYSDLAKFRAQYYNDPNDSSLSTITSDMFQYYNKEYLEQINGKWYYKNSRLNLFAAIDFAFSEETKADFTSIVVIGIDSKSNIYVLDVVRFKTRKISEYYEQIFKLYSKWDFRKLRAEITAAQAMIVRELKDNYIRKYGLALSIEETRPTKRKEERIESALQPKYANLLMWHYKGGNCQILEEELTQLRPSHDDVKDSLASAVEIAIAPASSNMTSRGSKGKNTFFHHPRFGGY